ncbi:MAG TPA: ATP-binding protein, partial [Steroidobacteraceae bacterium]|nr:ATP-binding protein [Steroidobacteraceae bacterium]
EIAIVGAAFNQMTASLARMEQERAIMLAGVSHDLRTPLAKLRLSIELLNGKAEAELLAGMTRATEAMDAIINQFLDYARAGEGEAPEAQDLNPLVRECAAACEGPAGKVQLELAPVPAVALRARSVKRAVTNLIENALCYGSQAVLVQTSPEADCVRLSVLDRGPGIPPAELEKVKIPFARGSTSLSAKGGAGLGLAIVDRIARAHGGRFVLLNRAQGGLEARLEFPL